MFSAIRHSISHECSWSSVQANVLAGLTVGVIALPLSMALAIASGVAPQHGLYTAIVAGIVTALAGGSKVNISGPTAGIGVVIATLQIRDFLGLDIESLDGHYLQKVSTLWHALPSVNGQELLIGAITFALMLLWPRLKSRIPGHLVALTLGSLLAWLLSQLSSAFSVATIGTRFH